MLDRYLGPLNLFFSSTENSIVFDWNTMEFIY